MTERRTYPPCAAWAVWEGPECEGMDFKKRTLFVRRDFSYRDGGDRKIASQFRRFWFCAEYDDWDTIDLISGTGVEVIVECHIAENLNLPSRIAKARLCGARVFLKFGTLLDIKTGDAIAFGEPYRESSYELKSPTLAEPTDYLDDKVIKP